jgi:hypothetical protein
MPYGSSLNVTLNNGSELDVDWLADINGSQCLNPSPFSRGDAIAAYIGGKTIWTIGNLFLFNWKGRPFQDPGERTAVSIATRPLTSYSDIFDEEFFQRECGSQAPHNNNWYRKPIKWVLRQAGRLFW